jgi:copper chaperone
MIISFRTNIKCGGCVEKVKPHLDIIKGIKSWNVDLASPDRVLTVEGEISDELIIKTIAAAGYRAEKIH